MKRVFISGPVSARVYSEVVQEFNKAEKMLIELGYEVVNPVKIVPPNTLWPEAMKICLKELKSCDAIFMLKRYEFSKGASMEYFKSRSLNLEIIFQE